MDLGNISQVVSSGGTNEEPIRMEGTTKRRKQKSSQVVAKVGQSKFLRKNWWGE